jgi:hypothetical protein
MKWVFVIAGVLLVPLAGATIAFFGMFIANGDDEHKARATVFYRWSVVVVLGTFNIWIFTRVFQGIRALM